MSDAGRREGSGGATVAVTGRSVALVAGALGLLALAVLAGMGRLVLPTLPDVGPQTGLGLIFLTGLSVGGLSCLAVQGGLLAAMIAQREAHLHAGASAGRWDHARPVLLFLVAKVLAYTILGAALGFFGSKIPLGLQGWVMIAAALFMVVTALQLYDVHPALRRYAFTPPKSVQRLVRRRSRRGDALAPLAIGALTVLIPCGVTVAMEVLAVASNDPVRGASVMLAFTLGTVPIFLLVGVVASQLGRSAYRVFKPVAAVAIVAIALVTLVSGLRLTGLGTVLMDGPVPRTTSGEDAASAGAQAGRQSGAAEGAAVPLGAGTSGAMSSTFQEATIAVRTGAFVPDRIQLAAGVPARITLVTENTQGCIRAFVIPSLGIERLLPATGRETIELPAQPPGRIDFMCSMGMYVGSIEVGDST